MNRLRSNSPQPVDAPAGYGISGRSAVATSHMHMHDSFVPIYCSVGSRSPNERWGIGYIIVCVVHAPNIWQLVPHLRRKFGWIHLTVIDHQLIVFATGPVGWWLKPATRCRQYINQQMKRLIRILSWGAGKGMIPASICEILRKVPIPSQGRTKAKEAVPITTVEQSIVDATIRCLTPVVADMVKFVEQ